MTPDKPLVFLSSVFQEDFGFGSVTTPLRGRIIEEFKSGNLPVDLWAYKIFWPKESETTKPEADNIVDRCFRGVKECDLFVFLLTGRHGSGVRYDSDQVLASYLELELFAAAMLDKPILVLRLYSNKEPQSELKDAMLLLHSRLPPDQYIKNDEDGLYDEFSNACDRLVKGKLLAQFRKLWHLAESLSRSRPTSGWKKSFQSLSYVFLVVNFLPIRRTSTPSKPSVSSTGRIRPSPCRHRHAADATRRSLVQALGRNA